MSTDLERDLDSLAAVTATAAEAYNLQGPALVAHVDSRLEASPRRDELIGRNALSVALENHANHWRFMSAVFGLNSYRLLARVLPWVYRAYTARGFALDYFVFVLGAYQEAIAAHLEPAQAAELGAVYRWITEHHEHIAQAASVQDTAPPVEPAWLGRVQGFCDLLLAGDARLALEQTRAWVQGPTDVGHFLQLVVPAAMLEVGRRWERNEISVAQEHLATAIVNRVVATLYPWIAQVEPWRGRALVSCAANEQHELGGRVLADLLELDGWDARFLGANTPDAALLAQLRREPVRLLALSVTMPFHLQRVRALIAQVHALPPGLRPRVLLGGRALGLAPGLWRELGGDAYAGSADAAVSLARAWSAPVGS